MTDEEMWQEMSELPSPQVWASPQKESDSAKQQQNTMQTKPAGVFTFAGLSDVGTGNDKENAVKGESAAENGDD